MISEHDRVIAVELETYIMNDGTLYRQMRRPIALNYARKMVRGTYDRELAVKGVTHLVKEGITKYEREFRMHKLQLPREVIEKIAKGVLAEMMPEINDTAKEMKALKKAGKPWTMTGR